MLFFVIMTACVIALSRGAYQRNYMTPSYHSDTKFLKKQPPQLLAAVLPGDPLITGTISQGAITSVSIFSNIILARFALSWFPQVLKRFPFLKPVITGIPYKNPTRINLSNVVNRKTDAPTINDVQ